MPDANYPIPGVAHLTPSEFARYRARGAWLDCSAGEMLRLAARRSTTKPALISQETGISKARGTSSGACLFVCGQNDGSPLTMQGIPITMNRCCYVRITSSSDATVFDATA